MKTSKLFITSLLAAAAMSATAYATSPTQSETDSSQLSFSGSVNDMEAGSNNTSAYTLTFNTTGGYFGTGSAKSQTFNQNIVIQSLTTTNGYSDGTTTFTGSVRSYSDDEKGAINVNSTGPGKDFIFAGDMSQYAGTITINGSFTSGTSDFNSKDDCILQFGAATAAAATNTANISGTGAISTNAVLRYNYLAGDSALTVGNSSISARYLEFKGGANYTVSSTVTGNNATAANNTLKISAGTTTFTGAVSNFGNVTVASGATLAVGAGGSLDLSGANVTLASAITNSGTVTLSGTTVFALDNLTATNGTYSLITGNSVTDVSGVSFTRDGSAIKSSRLSVSTASGYAVTVTNYSDLVWAGTAENSVWNTTAENWSSTTAGGSIAFENRDSVTFGTGTENNVTIAENLAVGAMTVSAATSFTGTGTVRVDAANLTTTAALTLGENVVLDLGSISSDTAVNNVVGTGTVKVSTGSNFKGLTLDTGFTGTIDHSGNITASNFGSNPNAKYVLSSGNMWGGPTLINISNDICFANYQIGNTGTTMVNFTGTLTQADGTTLTIGGNANTTATFSGAGTVISDLRISAGTLTMNAGQATIKGSQSLSGNLTINNGATVYVAQNDSLNYGGSNTITVNQGGVLSFGNYRWTVGQNNKIVINGGEISGAGDGSNGALDFYQANTAAVTASAGSTSTISAAIRLRGFAATFTTNDGATLTLSGVINHTGTLVKAGNGELIVSGANTYTGGTTISGGVLTVKNATALGTTAGTTTVNSGGVLKIAVNGGLTAGTVTLNEGALLAIDLTAYSNVEEGTALTIISSSAISFNSQEFSSDLMENTFFDLENSDLGSWSSYLREWSYDTTNGLRLTLTIPEPSMFGLLAGLGALALAGTRRRRRK